MLKKILYDVHTLHPSDFSLYRATINDNQEPFDKKSRIMYNPDPEYISRANIKGFGIGYYASDMDVGIIECSQNRLRETTQRYFNYTICEVRLIRKLHVQIICSSKVTQATGTDLWEFYNATKAYRFKESISRGEYRTWYLKTRFLANQYAKNKIGCEQDYYLSALHANTVLKSTLIDGIIYPSVPYFYSAFNYVFPLRLFQDDSTFELKVVHHVEAFFNVKDYKKYPDWRIIKSTNSFEGDKILWNY